MRRVNEDEIERVHEVERGIERDLEREPLRRTRRRRPMRSTRFATLARIHEGFEALESLRLRGRDLEAGK